MSAGLGKERLSADARTLLQSGAVLGVNLDSEEECFVPQPFLAASRQARMNLLEPLCRSM
jgi:hypothetical protein